MNPALAVARAVHFGASMLAFGEIVFVAFVAGAAWQRAAIPPRNGGHTLDRHMLAFTALALVASAFAGIAWLLIEATEMAGATIGQVVRDGAVVVVLRQTEFGHVFALRVLLWLALVASMVWMRRARPGRSSRLRVGVVPLMAAAYLAALAGAGHAGAATEGLVRVVHIGADSLHLLAAGGWLGALPPLVHCFAHGLSPDAVARLARRFSVLGVVCVGALIATGIVNALFLVGSFAALFGTAYGQLLVVKLALFAVMLAIAATNRFRLTPRLTGDDRARRALRRNAMLEIAIGSVIIAFVGALGTMVPGAHQSPLWPFTFALNFTFANLSRANVVALIGSITLALAAIALMITAVQRKAMRLAIPGVMALLVSVAVSM